MIEKVTVERFKLYGELFETEEEAKMHGLKQDLVELLDLFYYEDISQIDIVEELIDRKRKLIEIVERWK